MMFEMPQYEVRFNDNAQWEEISEVNIMQQLWCLGLFGIDSLESCGEATG